MLLMVIHFAVVQKAEASWNTMSAPDQAALGFLYTGPGAALIEIGANLN